MKNLLTTTESILVQVHGDNHIKKVLKEETTQQKPDGPRIAILISSLAFAPCSQVRRQCMGPHPRVERSSMNNSQRSSKWHFVFSQYYSAYTLNKAGWAAHLGGGWVPLSRLHCLFRRIHGWRPKHMLCRCLWRCCIFVKSVDDPLLAGDDAGDRQLTLSCLNFTLLHNNFLIAVTGKLFAAFSSPLRCWLHEWHCSQGRSLLSNQKCLGLHQFLLTLRKEYMKTVCFSSNLLNIRPSWTYSFLNFLFQHRCSASKNAFQKSQHLIQGTIWWCL